MKHILIFAGTTEGRELMEKIKPFPVEIYISVATEYGKECLLKETEGERAPYAKHGEVQAGNINVIAGRMKMIEIRRYIQKQKIDLVVDATHPFAVEITKNILPGPAVLPQATSRCRLGSSQVNLVLGPSLSPQLLVAASEVLPRAGGKAVPTGPPSSGCCHVSVGIFHRHSSGACF